MMTKYLLMMGVCLAAATLASAQVTKPLPRHWGCPPLAQTGDLTDLPLEYGRGSTTLAQWINANLQKDKLGGVAPAKMLYQNDFTSAPLDKAPEDFLVLDGAFAVKAENANKFLDLPGAPLDNFGALFGPATSNNVAVAARIRGTNKGRRFPVFGVGLNGAGGLKLQVAPGKRVLEILKGDESVAQVPYAWEPGKWTMLLLQVRSVGEGEWQAEGKAWTEGSPEPFSFLIAYKEKSVLSPGRPALWGSPISGTPIQFDDLLVTTVGR